MSVFFGLLRHLLRSQIRRLNLFPMSSAMFPVPKVRQEPGKLFWVLDGRQKPADDDHPTLGRDWRS